LRIGIRLKAKLVHADRNIARRELVRLAFG